MHLNWKVYGFLVGVAQVCGANHGFVPNLRSMGTRSSTGAQYAVTDLSKFADPRLHRGIAIDHPLGATEVDHRRPAHEDPSPMEWGFMYECLIDRVLLLLAAAGLAVCAIYYNARSAYSEANRRGSVLPEELKSASDDSVCYVIRLRSVSVIGPCPLGVSQVRVGDSVAVRISKSPAGSNLSTPVGKSAGQARGGMFGGSLYGGRTELNKLEHYSDSRSSDTVDSCGASFGPEDPETSMEQLISISGRATPSVSVDPRSIDFDPRSMEFDNVSNPSPDDIDVDVESTSDIVSFLSTSGSVVASTSALEFVNASKMNASIHHRLIVPIKSHPGSHVQVTFSLVAFLHWYVRGLQKLKKGGKHLQMKQLTELTVCP